MGHNEKDGFDPPPAAIPVTPPIARSVEPPTAPPTTAAEAVALAHSNRQSVGPRVEDRKIILPRHAVLPTIRCIKCNEPSDGQPLKRKLAWHSPFVYLLLLLNALIYLIVALIVRKKAVVHVGLCDKHRSQRTLCLVLSTVLIVLPIVATMLALALDIRPQFYLITCLVGLIVGLIVIAIGTKVITPCFIDDQFVHIKGAGRPYLDSLTPQYQRT